MQNPLQVGITGGIGSGKSLVCKIFRVFGAPIYDADSRAKNLMTTDGILIDQIKKEFGTLSYDGKGALNRQFLSKTVFADAEKLAALNKLVHPRVGVDYANWVKQQAGAAYVIKEAALMFESGANQQLDKIIVVSAPEGLRIERVLARDPHRTRDQVKDIILNQMSEEEKIKKADYVLMNDESTLLTPRVLDLHKKFIA